ncbi:MAG: type I DNA topoisomerase, partial [Proteobacteria bacterium]|nr:type I DNA topoisomerase [Candidatus Avisuccinivibrio stercorigallinarum]
DINMDLVNAQQTRRFLDRVVGYMVSPLLWSKVARGLSAGRVQSVAVEIIVDREREIKAFVPKEYWTVDALVHSRAGENLTLNLITKDGEKLEIHNAKESAALCDLLRKQQFIVDKIEQKEARQYAPPPFTTSTLQQTANQRLGFSVRRTMTAAQRLYEAGFITYMRTDSVNLSADAIAAARDIIGKNFGPDYLPEKPNHFKSKSQAQEAHEAIRPSHPEITANQLPVAVDKDGQRLYALIYARYLACQMTPERHLTTTLNIKAGPFGLKCSGRVILFDGFRRVLGGSSAESVLPKLSQGDELLLDDLNQVQHFTQPPARFSEATLVKELDNDGIGRPSTYASIIATIQDRGYVRLERGRFYAEKMGEIVTDRLRYSFSDLMDPHFTAQMETELDEIASGKVNWINSLNSFYHDFSAHLKTAALPADKGGMPDNHPITIDMLCPQCGKYHMAVHSGRTGMFLACEGYYDKNVPAKERCRKTLDLKEINLNKAASTELTADEETAQLRERKRCPKCGAAMDPYLIDEHLKLHLCGNSPRCDGYLLERGDFSDEIEKGPEVTCERCGSPMVLKEGRFGKYMACTNAECGNTRKILKSGEVAPPREKAVDLPELPCEAEGAHYVLRDGATGIFLAASTFPKVRETRPPKVSELKRFRDRISPKFYYLADGPETDPEGNPFEVRYSRKLKQQYLLAANEQGKTTCTAYFDAEAGVWQLSESSKSKAAASAGSASAAKKSTAKKSSTRKTTAAKKTTSTRTRRSSSAS